jgi:hypothetical protein
MVGHTDAHANGNNDDLVSQLSALGYVVQRPEDGHMWTVGSYPMPKHCVVALVSEQVRADRLEEWIASLSQRGNG